MGQKTHPVGLRLQLTKNWSSNWFPKKGAYATDLAEDIKLRKYLKKRLQDASVAGVNIERTSQAITVTIHTARPGIVIGRGGEEVSRLKKEVSKLCNTDDIHLNISEVKRPEFVKVSYLDIEGKSKDKIFEGFESVCVQHEIDHLAGTLFTSYISRLRRQIVLKKMQKFKKNLNKAI